MLVPFLDRAHEHFSQAFLEFAGGFLREGDDEDLVEGYGLVGQEAQHELLDGMRLARAGGRFHDGVLAEVIVLDGDGGFAHDFPGRLGLLTFGRWRMSAGPRSRSRKRRCTLARASAGTWARTI